MKDGTVKVLAVATVLAFMCMAFACVDANNSNGNNVNKITPVGSTSGTDGGIDWEIDTDVDILRISASAHPDDGYESGVMKDYPQSFRPWNYYGHNTLRLEIKEGVKNIGAYAFIDGSPDKDFKGSIFLPDSVKEIGVSAFENSGFDCWLKTTATKIGACAFKNCKLHGDLDLSETSYIDHEAFSNCDKFDGKLTIGASYIGDLAFSKCNHLTGIFFVNSQIDYLGGIAFGGCDSVNEISLKSVNTITYVYADAFGMTHFVDENNVPITPDLDLRVLHGMDFTGTFDGTMVRCN